MTRRPARILDVDGTLCDVRSVRHFVMRPSAEKDFVAFHNAAEHCPAIPQAIDYAVETVRMGMVAVVVTARMEQHYDSTRRFLNRVMPVPYDGPIMRQDGDLRPDRQVKHEILRYLLKHYDIRGAIDDNPGIVELYTQAGIPVEIVPGFDLEAASAYQPTGKIKAPRL